MSTLPLRVAVLSRSRIVQDGVTALVGALGDEAVVVPLEEAATGDPVDVVVLDLDGPVATDVLAAAPTVGLTRVAGPHRTAPGVHPVLTLDATPGELLAALLTRAQPQAPRRPEEAGLPGGLSPRELRVVGEIARGRSNLEIADLLYVSENTVKTYIRTAYRKIGASTRSQAILWAVRHGMVPHGAEEAPASQDGDAPDLLDA
jgi:DNA-binding CsgD family transcriptional regulator